MNGVIASIVVMFLLMWGCAYCVTPSKTSSSYRQGNNVVVAGQASEGFDLKALPALVKNVKTAEELEKKLNEANGINNLDLDADGKVDFIKVTEYGNKTDQFGFSLTAEPAKGEEQEIATIEIYKDDVNQKADIQVAGNQQVYGPNSYYRSSFGITEMLLLGYLLSPHSFYRPGWGYGYYPSYYRPYSSISYNSYRDRGRNYYGYNRAGSNYSVNKSSARQSNITSPNAGKVANNGINRSLANPTASQRSFQARSSSKSVGRGGFGRGSRSSSSSGRSFGGRGK